MTGEPNPDDYWALLVIYCDADADADQLLERFGLTALERAPRQYGEGRAVCVYVDLPVTWSRDHAVE